jgi:hypothetical protein
MRVALEEGERPRGVVHGDAADGPHRGQAARVREDGQSVVQEPEGTQVVARALMMRRVEAAGYSSCRCGGGDGDRRRRCCRCGC